MLIIANPDHAGHASVRSAFANVASQAAWAIRSSTSGACSRSATSTTIQALLGTGSGRRAHVESLASPRLEGRLAGSNGERLASDYIIAELQKIGAKPLPGQQEFRLPFEFTAGTRDGGSTVGVSLTNPTADGVDPRVGALERRAALSVSERRGDGGVDVGRDREITVRRAPGLTVMHRNDRSR